MSWQDAYRRQDADMRAIVDRYLEPDPSDYYLLDEEEEEDEEDEWDD